MKKNNQIKINKADAKVQKGESIKTGLPIKNAMTDDAKNAALETQGLNQANTTRDDLFPSDGDNLTN